MLHMTAKDFLKYSFHNFKLKTKSEKVFEKIQLSFLVC